MNQTDITEIARGLQLTPGKEFLLPTDSFSKAITAAIQKKPGLARADNQDSHRALQGKVFEDFVSATQPKFADDVTRFVRDSLEQIPMEDRGRVVFSCHNEVSPRNQFGDLALCRIEVRATQAATA